MIQAVVFDIGETIIDETRLWRMWAEWFRVPTEMFLAELRASIARREHHRCVFEKLQPGFDLAAAQAARIKAGVPDEFHSEDLYPDVAECIGVLRGRGLRMGIAGNQPASAERVLRELALPVDFVAASARWGVEKPDRRFFEKIIEEMDLPAGSIAYVGDRVDNDILPAAAAGMIAVLVERGPWGTIHAGWPEASRARLRVRNLSDLPGALARLGG
jgi:HAD superfamily hydrolase (TIGR01662 family)